MQGKKTKEAINKGNCERHEKVTKRTGKEKATVDARLQETASPCQQGEHAVLNLKNLGVFS